MSRRKDARSPWRRLRDLEPPLGSQQRVLARVEKDIFVEAPPARRTWIGGLVAAAAVGVLAWWGLRGPSVPLAGDVERPLATIGERGSEGESGATSQALGDDGGDRAPALVLDADAETPLELPRGRVVVSGTSSVRINGNAVILSEGRVVVSGFAHIKTPGCRARIDGDAEIRVGGDVVDIRVSRGSADVSPGCHVKYVALAAKAPEPEETLGSPFDGAKEPPASPPKSVTLVQPSEPGTRPVAPPSKSRKTPIAAATRLHDWRERATPEQAPGVLAPPSSLPSPSSSPSSSPLSQTPQAKPKAVKRSELRKQVDAFRRARRVAASDAAKGLRAYDEFLRRWPHSPLRPELEAERKRTAARQSP